MSKPDRPDMRRVAAVHARREVTPDAAFEVDLAAHLRATHDRAALEELCLRFANGRAAVDVLMRRAAWRALARQFGNGVNIGVNVGFKHVETFAIADGVFIGDHAYLQGRFDGTFEIGAHTWLGPQSYFDARHLKLGEYVGWGPGAKVLGSTHTGLPVEIPILQTDLDIAPVVVEDWADIGVNAVILPGVTIGRGSIVGAGAVVTKDVAPFSIVAGVPAVFLRWREGFTPDTSVKA